MTSGRLELSRDQILAVRRTVGLLDERLPIGPEILRSAAWAGLQDSAPRAALLSIHARVAGIGPSAWEDPSLVQVWGPRFSVHVVAEVDRAIFTVGRLPDDDAGQQTATRIADRLEALLAGRTMSYAEAGHALGVNPNALRCAAPTGRILLRWDGARPPTIRAVPPPDLDPRAARLELARRHLRVFGPTTPAAFAAWAGIAPAGAHAAYAALLGQLIPVRAPIGDAWIRDEDRPLFLSPRAPTAAARLLPGGDAFTLLKGAERELLVPDTAHRAGLWTPRVWPGAVLVGGELAGTWRRAGADVSIDAWRRLTRLEREAVHNEAESLPLPGLTSRLRVTWNDTR